MTPHRYRHSVISVTLLRVLCLYHRCLDIFSACHLLRTAKTCHTCDTAYTCAEDMVPCQNTSRSVDQSMRLSIWIGGKANSALPCLICTVGPTKKPQSGVSNTERQEYYSVRLGFARTIGRQKRTLPVARAHYLDITKFDVRPDMLRYELWLS